ncbi:MAG: hypothetical protein AB8B85_21030 [Paracoccaceae bacterium]
MSLIADGLLIATCLTAAVYCFVLAQRLRRFSSTEAGVGQQILQLNKTLEDTRTALKEAQSGAKAEAENLAREVIQARKLASQLKSMLDHPGAASAVVEPAAVATAPEAVVRAATPEKQTTVNAQPQGLVAAAAVPLDDNAEIPTPVEELVEEFPDEVDPADLDMNALLAASTGEQQLGFLPEPDEPEQKETNELTAEDVEIDKDLPDFPEQTAIDRKADVEDVPGNLLKVERMAL